MITIISLILAVIGGLNWLSVGLFDFNPVSWIFAGDAYFVARIIFVLVGLASVWVAFYLIKHFKAIAHMKEKND